MYNLYIYKKYKNKHITYKCKKMPCLLNFGLPLWLWVMAIQRAALPLSRLPNSLTRGMDLSHLVLLLGADALHL